MAMFILPLVILNVLQWRDCKKLIYELTTICPYMIVYNLAMVIRSQVTSAMV